MGSQANGQDSGQAGGQCPEKDDRIPIGISNRHVHLSREDLLDLFGVGYELTKMKGLPQPGQYVHKETVAICGPKGVIERVRIPGPVCPRTQVEIPPGNSFKLGVKAPARLSGDLNRTPGITIIGPRDSVRIRKGLMAAQRHIHMLPQDTARLGVHSGWDVSLEINEIRGGILRNTIMCVTGQSGLECHIDTEEANVLGLNSSCTVEIVR